MTTANTRGPDTLELYRTVAAAWRAAGRATEFLKYIEPLSIATDAEARTILSSAQKQLELERSDVADGRPVM